MKEVKIGAIIGIPGKIVYGFLDVLEHPVGTVERLPIIIAQGINEGPVLWLTANIHGDEYTGIPVIHRVINKLNLKKLKGTIVAIPSLNPSGSRTKARYPYYDKQDPNRLFPDGNPFKEKSLSENTKSMQAVVDSKKTPEKEFPIKNEKINENKLEDYLAVIDDDALYPSIQEQIWKKLFTLMKDSADFVIDLHNAYINSIPFIFLDRVLYNPESGEDTKLEAEKLYNKTEEMVKAFGFTIIREFVPQKYIQKKLHRSVTGATLNYLRIPSCTVELGMYMEVDYEVVNAAEIGIINVLKWAGMLDGTIKKITNIPIIAINEAVRHVGHPRIKNPALIEMQVKKGTFVKKGDIIAKAFDIFGRPLKDEPEIHSEIAGYVFMINEGILRYPNEEICWIAAQDTNPMIDKWPKKV